ncbi:hypothetical protein QA646_13675 [Rhizobium sp. CB3090]|uniref:hypothetical protein n=1 Tax=Rhizobium sp. CB3090 TaxID=3039156 RepID=UPI0024B0DDEE|nr:hypothetical protein [Rhizobium sp. CB3090]WFU08342.1 hypothetical protein QA646_13675 [Rhizobium sp. CB3090]
MDKRLDETWSMLESIAAGLAQQANGNALISDAGGWNHPAITALGLAQVFSQIATSLRDANISELSDEEANLITAVNRALTHLYASVLPNYTGNPMAAGGALLSSLSFIQGALSPWLGWSSIPKSRYPSSLARRLNQLESDLANIMPDKERLTDQVSLISNAVDAAEALPTTIQELKTTQQQVRDISSKASEFIGKIGTLHADASLTKEEIDRTAAEGRELIKQASEAYRITTTIGLAAAFDDRARKLNSSMYIWVAGLGLSLILLLIIGAYRLSAMHEVFSAPTFDSARVWTQILLSILSIGAPVWFAWLSTKQIGQRFRLAEDYAFKASVSKAYEGYRREAKSLDPTFAEVLFKSALSRLDEAPLRLLEMSTHGSPLHELAESRVAAKLIKALDRFNRRSDDSRRPASPEGEK